MTTPMPILSPRPRSWTNAVRDRPALCLAVALLAIDGLMIGAYLVAGINIALQGEGRMPAIINLDDEASLQSYYNVLKWAFMAVVLAWAFLRTRDVLFLAFALCFVLVVSDDHFALHETLGGRLADAFALPAFGSLGAQDLGELVIYGLWALLIGSAAVVAFMFGREENRTHGYRLFFLLGALGVVAVGLDMIWLASLWAGDGPMAAMATGLDIIAEDGGELLVASVGCGLALAAFLDSTGEPVSPAARA